MEISRKTFQFFAIFFEGEDLGSFFQFSFCTLRIFTLMLIEEKNTMTKTLYFVFIFHQYDKI